MNNNPVPRANEYLSSVVNEIKPLVEKSFNVSKDRSQVFMAGSSFAGLTSLYAVYKYPEVFGGCMAFSPSFWLRKGLHFNEFKDFDSKEPLKIYLDMGGKEDGPFTMSDDIQKTKDFGVMAQSMGSQIHVNVTIDEMAGLTAAEWTKRLPSAIFWLLNSSQIK